MTFNLTDALIRVSVNQGYQVFAATDNLTHIFIITHMGAWLEGINSSRILNGLTWINYNNNNYYFDEKAENCISIKEHFIM